MLGVVLGVRTAASGERAAFALVPLAGYVESGAARRQHREPGAGFE